MLKITIKICLTIFFLLTSTLSESGLTAKTANTIQGRKPTFTQSVEDNINNFNLFGITYTSSTGEIRNYYGDNAIKSLPLSAAYPFSGSFSIAPIKPPTSAEYLDDDGDLFDKLLAKTSLSMQWYYTDTTGSEIAFTPKTTDTFCALTSSGKAGPYKIKISGDLILTSIYGNPNKNEYPNDIVTIQPSKTYIVLNDAGICYAKPELSPSQAKGSSLNQWDKNKGFLIQSLVDPSLNFPQTGFYGAKFELVMAKNGLINNYNWSIKKGGQMVNITPNADTITVSFDTTSSRNTQIAWMNVASNGRYQVVIEGIHKAKGYAITYPFEIKTWFSGWSKSNITNATQAYSGNAKEIVSGCNSLDGNYRISHADEVSNAPFSSSSGGAVFSREIGKLLGEWGDANQTTYPGSWAAKSSQGSVYKRIWLYDTSVNDYCDLHTYNAKYHCISESGKKNGLCTAIP